MKKLLLMLAFSVFAVSCSDDSSSTSTNTTPVASTIKDKAGNEYKVVKIGSQTWMVENLKIFEGVGGPNSNCRAYDDNKNNISEYGCLYNMVGAKLYAPTGYRLPTKSDWEILFANVGGISKAGCFKSLDLWKTPNMSAANKYGFNALPGGYTTENDGSFISKGEFGNYWCAPTASDSTIRYVSFQYQKNEVMIYTASGKQYMSVRYIKDTY